MFSPTNNDSCNGKKYCVKPTISYPKNCEEYKQDDDLIQGIVMQKLHDCVGNLE